MPTLRLDETEVWTIHEHVRRQRGAPEYGQEWELETMQRLWDALLAFGPTVQAVDVTFTRGELLQVTRQVSTLIMAGSRPVGREILRKAITALRTEEEPDVLPIPAVFERATYDDADPDGAVSGADAPAESG